MRPTITLLAIGGVIVALAMVLAVVMWQGIDSGSTPVAVSLAGSIATVSAALVAASRADRARVHAKRSEQIAEFTASKTAAIQQELSAHCGDLCPSPTCPLRRESA